MLHEMLMLVKRKCKQILRVSLKNLPYFKPIYAQLDALEVPPGHVYSPIPDLEDIKAREQAIFDDVPADIPGIELNEEHQLTLLGHFKKYYDEQPFSSDTTKGLRYHFDNLLYPYSDAIILYCMIRHHTPKLIIEVGASGYSSCLILDVNERFLNNTLRCICIDPNGGSVLSSLEENDERNFSFIKKRVQDVDLRLFGKLCIVAAVRASRQIRLHAFSAYHTACGVQKHYAANREKRIGRGSDIQPLEVELLELEPILVIKVE